MIAIVINIIIAATIATATIDMKPNRFLHRISKEEVSRLPLVQFEGEVIVVNNASCLAVAIDELNQCKVVGVDTETRPSFVHGQRYSTALVQIATEKRCYLFQLRHIGFPEELAMFFADPSVCKVGLAFADDLRGLQRLHPFRPQNCVDVQKMVHQYGILDLGLQKIFAILFGKRISKSQQLTNWENPVLTPEQARYASTDAWATLLIYKELCATRPLYPKMVEILLAEDRQRQIEYQQQVLEQRAQQMHEVNE